MEIKILCGCGAKFKFDVEPVDGRSPGAVHCPACGKDGTEATNAMIRERLSTPAAAPIAVAAPSSEGPKVAIPSIRIPAAAPPPSPAPAVHVAAAAGAAAKSPSPAAAPQGGMGPKMAFMPAPAGGGSSLSVAGHGKKEQTPAAAPEASPPGTVTAVPASHPAVGKVVRSAPPASNNFTKGLAGGIAGAVIGAIIWYFVAVNALAFRPFAIFPGLAAGALALALGKKGSEKLATFVAVVVAIVTALTQLAVISGIKDKVLTSLTENAFNERMELAKQASNAKSDEDIRKVMVEDPGERFEGVKPDQIETSAVEKYRAGNLMALQRFAKGEPSRAKFAEKERAKLAGDDSNVYRGNLMMIIWVVSGVTSCFQMIRGKK